MERYALADLRDWLALDTRNPLILRGVRQVDPTWLVRELANRQLVEVNFEWQRELAVHFESNNPATILLNLESALSDFMGAGS